MTQPAAQPPDRTAVVTGAGGGLGAAVVSALRDAAMRVVAVDRSVAALSELPSEVVRETCDLTDPASVDALFGRVSASHGRIDAVVHTVGAFRGGAIVDSTVEDYRMLLDVNLGTAWWVSRAAAVAMKDGGGDPTRG